MAPGKTHDWGREAGQSQPDDTVRGLLTAPGLGGEPEAVRRSHSQIEGITMNHLKRLGLIAIITLALGLVAGPAVAGNPHVVKGPAVSVTGNTLTITASIAGLGNVPSASFTLTGSVDVFSQCYNKGGHNPAADNKEETVAVNESGTFPVRNGRTNVSFAVSPLSTLDCPGNQVVRIESVSWDLTLAGEGLTIPISGSAP